VPPPSATVGPLHHSIPQSTGPATDSTVPGLGSIPPATRQIAMNGHDMR